MMRIVLVALTALLYAFLQREDPTTLGTVEGVVRQGPGGTPVGGIPVQLRHRLGSVNYTTDVSGRFVFRDIPPGKVEVSTNQRTAQSGLSLGSAFLTLNPGQQVSGLEIFIYKGGVVSGRVALTSGLPAVGVSVNAVTKGYQIDGRCVFENAATARTDDNGSFRIFGLKPGQYFIRTQNLASDGRPLGTARSYVFFPGTLDPERSQPIVVRDGQETGRIDLVISRSMETQLSGRIEANPPLDDTMAFLFWLRKLDGCDPIDAAPSRSVSNGFEGITAALPGAYELIVSVASKAEAAEPALSALLTRANLGSARKYTGRTRVNVTGPSLGGILVRVHTLLPLSGRVVVADGSSAVRLDALGALLVYPDDTGIANSTAGRGLISRASVKGDGQFTVPTNSDGTHFLFIEGLPEDAYVRDILRDERSIFDKGIEIGSAAASVEVVLDSRGGRISGIAENQPGKGLPSVRAVLIPKSRRENPLLYKTSITDAQGAFAFHGVAPGEYQLFAFDEIPENAWRNAEYFAPYEDRGVPLRVDAAEKVTNIRVRSISTGQ